MRDEHPPVKRVAMLSTHGYFDPVPQLGRTDTGGHWFIDQKDFSSASPFSTVDYCSALYGGYAAGHCDDDPRPNQSASAVDLADKVA